MSFSQLSAASIMYHEISCLAGRNYSDKLLFAAYYPEWKSFSWSGNEYINTNRDEFRSLNHPALAVYNNNLYMLWSHPSYNHLLFSSFNGETHQGWSNGWSFPYEVQGKTQHSPALTVYAGRLYAVWNGVDNNGVYYASFDSQHWTPQTKVTLEGLPSHLAETDNSPSIAIIDNKLHAIWKIKGQNALVCSYFNGHSWTVYNTLWHNELLYNIKNPRLIVYKNTLYTIFAAQPQDVPNSEIALFGWNIIYKDCHKKQSKLFFLDVFPLQSNSDNPSDPYNIGQLSVLSDCIIIPWRVSGRWTHRIYGFRDNTIVKLAPEYFDYFTRSRTVYGTKWKRAVIYNTQNSLCFDRNTSIIDCGEVNIADTDLTIAFWAKRESLSNGQDRHFIMGQGIAEKHKGLHICFDTDNTFMCDFYHNGVKTIKKIEDKEWHHFVLIYNKTERSMHIFIDGINVVSATNIDPFQGNGKLLIGQSTWEWIDPQNPTINKHKGFRGYICRMEIYKQVVPFERINELQYNCIKTPFFLPLSKVKTPVYKNQVLLNFGSYDTSVIDCGEVNIADTDLTIAFWAKRESLSNGQDRHFIMGQGIAEKHKGLHVCFDTDNTFMFDFYNNGVNTTKKIEDKEWHHFILTYNKTERSMHIFIDGINVASATNIDPFQGSGKLLIGQSTWEWIDPQNPTLNKHKGFMGNLRDISIHTDIVKTYWSDDIPSATFLNFGSYDTSVIDCGEVNIADTDLTIAFWAKRESLSNGQDRHFIMGQGIAEKHKGLHVCFDTDNTFMFDFYNNGVNTTKKIEDKEWHHFILTYNKTERSMHIFIDGINVASATNIDPFQGSGKLLIGQSTWEWIDPQNPTINKHEGFRGYIAEVKICNKVITPSKLLDFDDNNSSNLIIYYPLTKRNDKRVMNVA